MALDNCLKEIFVSRTRLKLLGILYRFPGEMYYIRQLVKLSGEKLNSVRRELEILRRSGVLLSESRANKIFYWTDKNFEFFWDFVSIFSKLVGLGKEIIQSRQRIGKIKFVVFSGKFVKNIPSKQEDVDVLVVGKVVLPELGNLIREEEKIRDREINYTVIEENEFQFRKKNRDPFLIRFLTQSRIMIIGDEQEFADY